jgi:hypothetical protein
MLERDPTTEARHAPLPRSPYRQPAPSPLDRPKGDLEVPLAVVVFVVLVFGAIVLFFREPRPVDSSPRFSVLVHSAVSVARAKR